MIDSRALSKTSVDLRYARSWSFAIQTNWWSVVYHSARAVPWFVDHGLTTWFDVLVIVQRKEEWKFQGETGRNGMRERGEVRERRRGKLEPTLIGINEHGSCYYAEVRLPFQEKHCSRGLTHGHMLDTCKPQRKERAYHKNYSML